MLLNLFTKFSKTQKISIIAVVAVVVVVVIITAVTMGGSDKKKNTSTETNRNTNQSNNENTEDKKEESPIMVADPVNDTGKSSITGLTCANADRRPFAVMMAGDTVARPLSGLSEADMVFEMPVITGSITRLMGVFGCNDPAEIGSLRSARHDYITLALGIDAVFVHWGGSHFALDDLKKGVADDIDALKHSGPFTRKSHIPKPHNGFTSMGKLLDKAKSLNYRLENKFAGYPHLSSTEIASASKKGTLEVGFAGAYKVKYEYDPVSNSYARFWNGTEDKDFSTGKTITAKNVVVMKAASRQIEGQYNDVDIEGKGEAKVYQNGEEITGKWKKDKAKRDSKLYFLDGNGKEIEFVPGQIWVEVIELYQEVKWSTAQ